MNLELENLHTTPCAQNQDNKQTTFSRQNGAVETDCSPEVDMNRSVGEQEKEIVEGIVTENFSATHMLECLGSLFKDAKSIPGLSLDESLIKNIELMVALINNLCRAQHWDVVASTFTLYFNNFTEHSVTSTLVDYMMEVFEFTPQAKEEGVSDLPAFIRMMRMSRDNWSLLKGNPLFSHFSKFLGLIVAVGLCEPSQVSFNLGKFKLFEPCMKTAHGNAENILEALFNTVTFFIERIYFCFKNKSVKPLLISDDEAIDMDEELAQLTVFWALHKNGNLVEVKGISEHEFERRLNSLGFKLKNLLTCKTGIEKQIIRDKYVKVLGMIGDLTIMNTNGDLREAPFHVQLYGDSGVGKSTAMAQIRNVLLASAGLPLDPCYQAAINPNDKYMSNWTSDKIVMILDDFANTRADKVSEPPTSFIIMAKNNAPAYAPKAEVDGKGKCAIKPKLMFTTTNVKDLAAAKFSVNPFSIQNRSDIVLVVKNRKECTRAFHGAYSLDHDKCNEWHATNGRDNSMVEDVWLVDMQRPVRPENENWVAQYKDIYNDDGKKMCNLPMHEVAEELVKMYAKHRDTQAQIIARSKEQRNIDYTLCGVKGCICPKILCREHKEHHMQQPVYDTFEVTYDQFKSDVVETESEREERESNSSEDKDVKGYDPRYIPSEARMEREFELEAKDAKKSQRLAKLFKAKKPDFEPHSGELGEKLDSTIDHYAVKTQEAISKQFSWLAFRGEDVATVSLIAGARMFSYYFDWMVLIPRPWLENETILKLTMLYNRENMEKKFVWYSILNWILPVFLFLCGLFLHELFFCFWFPSFMHSAFSQMGIVHVVQKAYRTEIMKRNDGISASVKEYRDSITVAAGKAFVGLGVLLVLSKFCARLARHSYKPQGNLMPKSDEDLAARDKEENVWAEQVVRKLPMSDKAKSSTPTELENNVKKNLFYAEVCANGRTLTANILYVRTNLIVIPVHYLIADHLEVTFYKDKSKACGGTHRYKISRRTTTRIGDTDLALSYCAAGGSMVNLLEYFPTGALSTHQFHMIFRKFNGDVIVPNGIANSKMTSNGFCRFPGGEYDKLDINTFEGLCGAVLVSHGSGSVITGFHLGGKAGTPKGCYGTLSKQNIVDSIKILEVIPGVLFSGNSGAGMKPQLMGKTILTNEPIHEKSPARYLPDRSSLQYYGTCIGRKTSKTTVQNTPISDIVAEVCEAPNIYRAPKFKPEWWGNQKALSAMSKPGTAYGFPLLENAIKDYIEPLEEKFLASKEWTSLRPLTDHENFNGVDGKRFIDKLVTKTSMGVLGLTPTSKKHYIVEEVDEAGELAYQDFTPEVRQLIDEIEEDYAKGDRSWTIAVANKKDEVLSKQKCRLFYANPIMLTWLLRKYFLPVARFIQMNPLLSECAVGINAHGPEWEQLQEFVLRFGKNALFNGDHKDFDLETMAELLFGSFYILIHFASLGKYSERHINIMRATTADIVYALIAFDGDLYGIVEGTHISGNSLTVILNSIVNSLHMRCAFYSIYKITDYEERDKFRDACGLACYGDDNTGSVEENHREFNMISISEFLEKHGLTYTNPDKTKIDKPFWPYEHFEFLKRSNRWNEDVGMHLGALDEKSIFKSLHCFLRGKTPALSQELACAQNIDGALREWFAHGKDVYEKRRAEMAIVAQTVVDKVPISSLCRELDTTYEQRVEDWKSKYVTDEPSD